jgi:hypothetical protein
MARATAIIMSGLVLLFVTSFVVGQRVFSPEEREMSQLRQTHQLDSADRSAESAQDKRTRMRHVRIAFSSFDLLGGLTNSEIINIGTMDQSFHIFYLLACVLLIIGLRKP